MSDRRMLPTNLALGATLTLILALTLALTGEALAQEGQASEAETPGDSLAGVPFPIPNPPPANGEEGIVAVHLFNGSEQPVAFSFQTDNAKNCRQGNQWTYGEQTSASGTTAPLEAGASGGLYMYSGSCGGNNGATFDQSTGPGAFSIGVEGGQQFEVSVDVSLSGNFEDIHWEGDYFGPASAQSLNLYNCGNAGVLGNGRDATNNSFKYPNGGTMCFTVCPHALEGQRMPVECLPPSEDWATLPDVVSGLEFGI